MMMGWDVCLRLFPPSFSFLVSTILSLSPFPSLWKSDSCFHRMRRKKHYFIDRRRDRKEEITGRKMRNILFINSFLGLRKTTKMTRILSMSKKGERGRETRERVNKMTKRWRRRKLWQSLWVVPSLFDVCISPTLIPSPLPLCFSYPLPSLFVSRTLSLPSLFLIPSLFVSHPFYSSSLLSSIRFPPTFPALKMVWVWGEWRWQRRRRGGEGDGRREREEGTKREREEGTRRRWESGESSIERNFRWKERVELERSFLGKRRS